jgi:hypothetical protein
MNEEYEEDVVGERERDDEPQYDEDAAYDRMCDDDYERLGELIKAAVAKIREKNAARPWYGFYSQRDEAKAWEDIMVICDARLEELKGDLPLGLVRRRDLKSDELKAK